MMKHLFYICSFFLIPAIAVAQEARIMTQQEIGDVLYGYETTIPVYEGYEYRDRDGLWNVLLCESTYSQSSGYAMRDTLLAVCFLQDHGGYLPKWAFRDSLSAFPIGLEETEADLLFWTSYCSFTDLDGDGSVDPVLVYATLSNEERLPVRVVIQVVYQQRRFTISAVECVLDNCRSLTYDPSYEKLPPAIKQHLQHLLTQIREERGVLLRNS